MNDDNLLGGVLGQLGQTAKQTAKQVIKIPQELGGDLGGQIGAVKQSEQKPAASAKGSGEPRWKSDEERVKFLRDLYGSGEEASSAEFTRQSASSVKPSADAKAMADKEEQKKMMELRNKLHKENYYDPTFNRPNPQASGEERPAEKVEKEKKQEMVDLQKKEEKKPPPLAVVRERNKAEMFRGASG